MQSIVGAEKNRGSVSQAGVEQSEELYFEFWCYGLLHESTSGNQCAK